MIKTAIIIPCFNEQDNIYELLKEIATVVPYSGIYIIDDSSASNWINIKREIIRFSRVYKGIVKVTVKHRNIKRGRGTAVIDGFKLALKDNFDVYIQMDADMSHDPTELPKLIKKYQSSKKDIVIASRYLKSSKIIDWPIYRRILSKVINKMLNIWLRLGLKDYTNGYRLYNKNAVNVLVKHRFRERGFIQLSEEMFLLKNLFFTYVEIPSVFRDRKKGKSSVTLKDLFYSLKGAIQIRFSNS